MRVSGFPQCKKSFKVDRKVDHLQKGPNLIEVGAFLLVHLNLGQVSG